MTVEANDTSTTTVATDPVQGNTTPTTVAPQEAPTNAPVNENKGIEAQLAEFLASQTKVEPEAPQEETPTERPTGGANDLTVDDVDDPQAKRIITLMDAHYPDLDRERVIGRALEYGDVDLIDSNYLRDQVGDVMAETILGFCEDLVTSHANSYDELIQEVYEQAGGKEQWAAIANAFRSKAPSHIVNTVRGLIDSNNREEVEQGLKFIQDFSYQTGLVDKTPKRVTTAGGGGGGDGLTAEQFSKALKELGHRNKDPKTYDATVASLRQRRATGISLGL